MELLYHTITIKIPKKILAVNTVLNSMTLVLWFTFVKCNVIVLTWIYVNFITMFYCISNKAHKYTVLVFLYVVFIEFNKPHEGDLWWQLNEKLCNFVSVPAKVVSRPNVS